MRRRIGFVPSAHALCSELYEHQCRLAKTRPNTYLVQLFGGVTLGALQEVDLGNTYIGNRGIVVLLGVLERCDNLRFLGLRDCQLYNADVTPQNLKGNSTLDKVIEMTKVHPTMGALDLRDNPISAHTGKKLLALCKTNTNIVLMNLAGTRIPTDLQESIQAQVKDNAGFGGGGGQQTLQLLVSAGDTSDFTPAVFDPDLTGFGADPEMYRVRKSSARSAVHRRKSVSAEVFSESEKKSWVPTVVPKPPEEVDGVRGVLSRNCLFNHLESQDLEVFLQVMFKRVFEKGQNIIEEGQDGDYFYVLITGSCDVYIQGSHKGTLKEGAAFGELALMYNTPRAATVSAASDAVTTFAIDRDAYMHIVRDAMITRRKQQEEFLGKIDILLSLTDYERIQLTDTLVPVQFGPGQEIIRQGEQDIGCMYMILAGTVCIHRTTEAGELVEIPGLKGGDYFGEIELLTSEPRVATVTAQGHVRCLRLSREDFERHAGPLVDVLKRNMASYQHYVGVASLSGDQRLQMMQHSRVTDADDD